mmetsp:Transcript_56843/g.106749  ORF Transcript_56843/g.106749 Transcript_56843/m.106749 type:complete len:237 (+) Transcript_56843:972-1682(+)
MRASNSDPSPGSPAPPPSSCRTKGSTAVDTRRLNGGSSLRGTNEDSSALSTTSGCTLHRFTVQSAPPEVAISAASLLTHTHETWFGWATKATDLAGLPSNGIFRSPTTWCAAAYTQNAFAACSEGDKGGSTTEASSPPGPALGFTFSGTSAFSATTGPVMPTVGPSEVFRQDLLSAFHCKNLYSELQVTIRSSKSLSSPTPSKGCQQAAVGTLVCSILLGSSSSSTPSLTLDSSKS